MYKPRGLARHAGVASEGTEVLAKRTKAFSISADRIRPGKKSVGRTQLAGATKPELRATGQPFTNARSPHDDVLASESPD